MIPSRPTTIRFRVQAASIAIAAVVAVSLAVLVVAISSLRSAVRREAHARDTLIALLTLERTDADLESSLRGYLLTSNSRFLRPWSQALKEVGAAERRLAALSEADTATHARVLALERSIDRYVSDYAEPLIAIARIAPDVASSSIAASEGKRRSDLLRARFNGLLSLENSRTAKQAASVSHASSLAATAVIATMIISGLLIVGLGAAGARALSRRLAHAARAASEVAAGDFSVRLDEGGSAEFVELGRAFNSMAAALDESRRTLLDRNRELQENERRKTELITIVSHELRTPLTVLLGFTDLLLRRRLEEPVRQRYVEILHDESRRLSALMERFLDVGRVEDDAFELDLRPVDIVELLREQSELTLSAAKDHLLVLALERPRLAVLADRDRLAQVLGKLMANAVKYSPGGGTVEVIARTVDGVVRVEIADRGIGIPEDDQSQIFKKFFRGRAAEHGIPGTGLGLAVAREIVEAHGGRIGFESTPGRGSTFWIELAAA